MQDFMKDRYGVDDLSAALGAVGVVLTLVGTVSSLRVVSIIALVILVVALARSFSKNLAARRRENEAFCSVMSRIPVVGGYFGGAGSAGRTPGGSARGGSPFGTGAKAGSDDFRHQARMAKKMWKDRKTKVFLKCPTCGQTLSVPKGKGRMIVTCPKCHTRMETRS